MELDIRKTLGNWADNLLVQAKQAYDALGGGGGVMSRVITYPVLNHLALNENKEVAYTGLIFALVFDGWKIMLQPDKPEYYSHVKSREE